MALREIGVSSILIVVIYITLLLSAAYIDIRTRRIPNRLSYPAIGFALVVRSLGLGLVAGLAGGAVAALIMLVPVLILGPDQAGIGDVKWATFIGLAVGFPAVLVALFVAAAGLSTVGLIGIALKRYHRQASAPFAPFLCLGGICALIWDLM